MWILDVTVILDVMVNYEISMNKCCPGKLFPKKSVNIVIQVQCLFRDIFSLIRLLICRPVGINFSILKNINIAYPVNIMFIIIRNDVTLKSLLIT